MKNNLILQDKNYISAKRAAQVFGYASDYVGQLCRSGKLECKMIGRTWFVTEESLAKHQLSISLNSTLPKKSVDENIPVHSPVESKIENVPVEEISFKEVVTEVPQGVVEEVPVMKVPDTTPKTVSTAYSIPSPLNTIVSSSLISVETSIKKSFTPDQNTFDKNTYNISHTQIHSANSLIKFSGIVALCSVVLFFILQSYFSLHTSNTFQASLPQNVMVASIISSSQNFIHNVVLFFSALPQLAKNIFNSDEPLQNNAVAEIDKPPLEEVSYGGLAVTPSTNSPEKDELIKEKIRSSFSDEVEVKPDKSGTAGVITPVFKKAKGDNFVYVLVPVSEKAKN